MLARRRVLKASAAFLVLLGACAGLQTSAAPRTENVILVVIDGVRWSESWGDPSRGNIPRLAAMAPEGVVCTRFRNNGTTSTNPGHASLMTGFRESLANDGSEPAPHPTLFQLWRKATGAPADAAWVVTAKGKLAILADSADPAWAGGAFNPSADCGVDGKGLKAKTRSDRETWEALRRILADRHPRAVVVNFAAPDARGHAGDRDGYLKAIREADGFVGELWSWLQRDPRYAGRTALFVTNDHGRHLDGVKSGFKDHGCDCEGCRHIMLFAFGPDFKRGAVVDMPREQIDVTATAAALLGVRIPGSKGEVMTELFAAGRGAEPPVREPEREPVPAGR